MLNPSFPQFLFQSENPGLKYEYTIPNANATRKPEFSWQYTEWSVCTVTCGGGKLPKAFFFNIDFSVLGLSLLVYDSCRRCFVLGVQTSTVKCMEKEAGLVEDKYCVGSEKLPDMSRACNIQQCPSKYISVH